jgi:phenylpyruvate tautomerase PptA (4-oxalocrotonate tautomerase family)
MPLVTFTLLKGRTRKEKKNLSDAVHIALVNSGVPEGDKFHRFFEMEKENLIYNPLYPDLTVPRSENFVIIEILLSAGRSVKIKKKILSDLMQQIQKYGQSPNDIFVVFKETTWENWAFANGVQIHV